MEELYSRLERLGFRNFRIKPKMRKQWGGYIDCHFKDSCPTEAVVFIDAVPYCLEHATMLVERIEAIAQKVSA
jgi:hypothetical protein